MKRLQLTSMDQAPREQDSCIFEISMKTQIGAMTADHCVTAVLKIPNRGCDFQCLGPHFGKWIDVLILKF